MTVQAQEVIEYKGEKYPIIGAPFEDYLEINKGISVDSNFSSANRRGYQGYWKLKNNQLFLTDLECSDYEFEQLFQTSEPIFASWFSGVIEIGFGEFKRNHWWGNYEKYLWIKFENGNVIDKRIRQGLEEDNYKKRINFGIYKGQTIHSVVLGKINSYRSNAIEKYIEAILISLKDFKKVAIVPLLGKKYYDYNLLNSLRNQNISFEVTSNKVSINCQDEDIAGQFSKLLEELLSLIYINLNSDLRSQIRIVESSDKDIEILYDSIAINPDQNYITWALKNVNDFCYPPQFLDRIFYLKELVGFKIQRLSKTIIEYIPLFSEKYYNNFSSETLEINQQKFENFYSVYYDKEMKLTFYNSNVINNSKEFQYFINEDVTERFYNEDDNYEEPYYDDCEIQSYEDWLNAEFVDDAETAYWNLD